MTNHITQKPLEENFENIDEMDNRRSGTDMKCNIT